MNVRIDQDSVRFRILPADLLSLLDGQTLERRLAIGDRVFAYRIAPAAGRNAMTLAMSGEALILSVPRRALEQLRDLGRSRDGISASCGRIEISLQVDLKAQTPKAA